VTARLPPNPDGLNRHGDGRGLKKVSKPVSKKRGSNTTEQAKTERIAQNRARANPGLSNMPVAEVANLPDNKVLTEKAKAFVRYWAAGESVPAASAKAGYGDGATYAYKLTAHPTVIRLYNEEKAKYEAAAQMTRKKVMDGLLDGIDMCKLAGDGPGVIQGWTRVGQMCGYFEPVKRRIDVNVTGNVLMGKLNALSDADLLKVIQEGVTNDLLALEAADE
jgi:hypothetical protein